MIRKALFVLSSVVLLSACGTANADEKGRFNVEFANDDLYIIVDTDTGCKYLEYSDYKEGGGVTPLLKADGTPDCN